MKLLPFRHGYRLAALGLIIGACHSGETRDSLAINPEDDGSDAGGDAEIAGASGAGASGTSGTSGNGGNPSQQATAGNGGADAAEPDSGSFGTDLGDLEDAGDATVEGDVEAGPSCGDGHTDLALDEECDDGNDQHSDGCESDCKRTRIKQVALGREFTCALSTSGGVKCWGRDTYGSLGRGTSGADVSDPSQIDIIDFGTTRRVTQLVASWYHACALFEDGGARCWGRNHEGQLGIDTQLDYGDGPAEQLNAMGDLALDHIESISVSELNTCVISDIAGANNLYCWGSNGRGELGIGSTTRRETPSTSYPAALNAIPTQVTLGYRSPCIILNGGSVRCFGNYTLGELGVGLIDFYVGDGVGDGSGLGELPNDPTLNVKGLPGPASAVIGEYYSRCALVDDDLYCWGRNFGAQVGYPVAAVGTEVWETPGRLNLGPVSVVQGDLANSHGCAIDTDGIARCWGDTFDAGCLGYPGVDYVGYYREPELDYLIMSGLADGGSPDAAVPGAESLPLGAVDVGDFDGTPGIDPIESIWVGYRSTCAIMETGGMRCWGQNDYNRLGYGVDVPNIGFTQSPADTYDEVGFSDVNVFGPPLVVLD